MRERHYFVAGLILWVKGAASNVFCRQAQGVPPSAILCSSHINQLSDTLPGYSASDLKLLVDEAARRARKARRPISEDDLRHAARELVPASVTPRDELRFLAFGQRGVKLSSYKVANDIASALRTVSAAAARRRVQLVMG